MFCHEVSTHIQQGKAGIHPLSPYLRKPDEASDLTPPVISNTKPVSVSSHKANPIKQVFKAVLSFHTACRVGNEETGSQLRATNSRLLSNSLSQEFLNNGGRKAPCWHRLSPTPCKDTGPFRVA